MTVGSILFSFFPETFKKRFNEMPYVDTLLLWSPYIIYEEGAGHITGRGIFICSPANFESESMSPIIVN